jgi:uncharacterized damage-inducible protein DinB
MSALRQLRRLWDHAAWADETLLSALEAQGHALPAAIREYAHILGAEEVWLSRLESRPSTAPVWPNLGLSDLGPLARTVRARYGGYLAALTEPDIERGIGYTNSAGLSFITPVGDILLQVVLHGQYHRGKVNQLLRQAGLAPAPVDFIGYVRGVPAATTAGIPPALSALPRAP